MSSDAKENRRQFTKRVAKFGFGAAVLGALGIKSAKDTEAAIRCIHQYYSCKANSCPSRIGLYDTQLCWDSNCASCGYWLYNQFLRCDC